MHDNSYQQGYLGGEGSEPRRLNGLGENGGYTSTLVHESYNVKRALFYDASLVRGIIGACISNQ